MPLDIKKIGSQIDLNALKEKAKEEIAKVDVDDLKEKASAVGSALSDKAVEIKDAAIKTKEDIEEKLTELDRILESSITEYNDAWSSPNLCVNSKPCKMTVG